jgi:hypothetical protein
MAAIEDFIDGSNRDPRPFTWTTGAKDILDEIELSAAIGGNQTRQHDAPRAEGGCTGCLIIFVPER